MEYKIDVQILAVILFLISVVDQVVADSTYCTETGKRCDFPAFCCPSGCCYDNRGSHHNGYSYRVSFYNLWYFWFIILFVLMTCFGGCGYYKQRQRYSEARGINAITINPELGRNAQLRAHSQGRFGVHPSLIPASHSNFGFTNSGDVPSNVTVLPPPYAQVMMQPDLYPAHKSELVLPAYPDDHQVSPDQPGVPNTEQNISGLPQPPPYSLFASSNQDSEEPAVVNQNAENNSNLQDVSIHQTSQ